MSQFMEVMMGQQSLLMTLANVVPRAPELPTGPVAGQPVVPPPVPHGQPQEVWDVDAVSRDASDAEPLFEEGTEPEVTSQHSEQDDPEVLDTNDPMWSVVERAARHLGVDWPVSEQTRRSLFELPSAQPLQSRILPAFPDFIKEVQSTWGAPASAPATSRKASAFTMHGASEAGLASFPPVGAAFAALVKAPTLSGLAKDPSCPNRQCRITEAHLKKGYAAATEAVRLSNVASLLTVYQAALLRDLPECPSVALRTELGAIAQLLVKLAQLNARAQGRSIASLVVARSQLWLSQARVQEPDKAPLLDAPISPGHTFGPAVEEMLQRSVKAREASQQLAKMWPSKLFQPRRPQERQWCRAPPQQQAQPRGSKTTPLGVSVRSQPAFARLQRGGWRPRGGGRPRPRGSGQAPRPGGGCGIVVLDERPGPANTQEGGARTATTQAGTRRGKVSAGPTTANRGDQLGGLPLHCRGVLLVPHLRRAGAYPTQLPPPTRGALAAPSPTSRGKVPAGPASTTSNGRSRAAGLPLSQTPPPAEGESLLVPPPPPLSPSLPPAEEEYLLVPPPSPWEDCGSLPPPQAEVEYLLVMPSSPPPAEGACLLVPPSLPPPAGSMPAGFPPAARRVGAPAAFAARRGGAPAAFARSRAAGAASATTTT
ncbi:UNVERIFIED_CONTAM: hypothetical protein FKN15_009949 [Acipenser sinensis]